MTAEGLAAFALCALIAISLLAALVYSIRVMRHKDDHLRWALLGVLASLALTNLPVLFWYLGYPLPLWVGAVARLASAAFLVWAVWPLLCDSWNEVKACVQEIRHRGSKTD